MTDVTDIRFARLGGMLEEVEAKALPVKKKGGKVKPKPPWLTDDEDAEDQADGGADEDTEDEPDERAGKRGRSKKALPAKPPAGFKAKKPVPAQNTAKARRKQTVTSPRGHLARVQHNSRGSRVSMRTLPAPAGFRAKSVQAGRPTVWGPQKQSVDITRVRTPATGSDARVNAAARTQAYGRMAKPGTGSAGGNGVTRGRGDLRAANPTPGNVRRGGGRGKVRHSGQMGEGAAWGRSGSAVIPHKPGNIKSLYEFTPDQLRTAMDVAAKAIRGVLADHESGK